MLSICIKKITGKESIKPEEELYDKLFISFFDNINIAKHEKELIKKEKKIFCNNIFNAEISIFLCNFLLTDKFVDAFKVVLYYAQFSNSKNQKYKTFMNECIRGLTLRLVTEVHKSLKNENYNFSIILSSIVGHIIVNVLDQNDFIRKAAVYRLEKIVNSFKNLKPNSFENYEDRFAKVFIDINNGKAVAQIDFDVLPNGIERIKKMKTKNCDLIGLETGNFEIAEKYYLVKDCIQNHLIYGWFKLAQQFYKQKSYSDRNFQILEENSGLLM